MKQFIQLIKRFVPAYKWYVLWSVISNILAAVLSLLSFSLIMPILKILFRIEAEVTTLQQVPEFSPLSLAWWREWTAALSHNFSYYVSELIRTEGASSTLVFLAIGLVLMTGLKVGVSYMALYAVIPLRTGVVRDIRDQINDKITQLDLSFFSEERKGDILARISGDVSEIESSVISSIDALLKNPILIIIYLIAMLAISWQLTCFVFVLLPIAGFVMGRVGKSLKRKSYEGQERWGQLMSMVEETLSGLRIVKAFNAESLIRERFRKANNAYRSLLIRVYSRQQLAHPMSEFLGTATIAVVLWYGGSLILADRSEIDAAVFIYYLVIFYSLINPAKDLSRSAYTVQKGMASLDRIDKILLAKTEITEPECPVKPIFTQSISYRDVWFRYSVEGDWVLRGINLEIPKGKTVALVGQSGSGKSTLVDLLPRFYDVEKGSICIDDTDIRKFELHDLRELMGNVNQEAILFNDSVKANISFGQTSANLRDIEEAARIANVQEFVEKMPERYDSNIGDRGSKLSGGQRQRLSIARAVLKNPPILILDEATSALDSSSELVVQEALEKLMNGRTAIVIAHRLSTVQRADIICALRDGQIVEQGTHRDLMALNGYYAGLYKMQFREKEA
ncbi:antibiotic ABC transporter ATP-binding protein [Porphyromonas crevioricanis]|uniref:Antibiotic ABC transporter ATP-binding protein n=1 Tax=Porphyromonas crevioricanis TaxID=393921 RepID=A0A0A2FG40_9PORP|nr:ABC transporter transmembrane domain-containing protein [Porphyromonas crevioricanis]KGN89943.1 antibiotic ABC transporter ATP-binding protein [Porphyromonas crevioricanis]KGN94127.1 antibiotic ABC transporter ATP-binding protein [Porphyromonas crevioricanis]GAD07158.1 ABC transporter, ATP-binding protein [Porphyromonas crevioricanis JCM 13913]SQH73936.1 Lipid A export ATP-binding/permease protein MsbA [Porphyromonas crevioricanis]